MILGGKVSYVVWLNQATTVVDEHSSRAHLSRFAGINVLVEVGGPLILELQGNPFPHHADAVHGVDDCINIALLEQITLNDLDHSHTSSKIPLGDHMNMERNARNLKDREHLQPPNFIEHADPRHCGQRYIVVHEEFVPADVLSARWHGVVAQLRRA
jgi:hypothetical protein